MAGNNARKTTGPKAASAAGKLLTSGSASKRVKTVAGSALTQAPNKRQK